MSKTPPPASLQFYPGDRLQDLMPILNDNEAIGAWTKAFMYLWRHGPTTAERLGLVVGSGWDRIGFLFTESDGLLSLDWMEEKRAETAAFLERQRANGRKGGRPKAAPGKGENPSLSNGLTQAKAKKSPRVEGEGEGEGEGEEEVTEVVSEPRAKKNADLPFASDAFAEAWAEWEAHRRAKRSALTPQARSAQLAKCAGWGEARAIAALKHSTSQGWTGLFEPPSPPKQTPHERHQSGVIGRNDPIETSLRS